MDGTLCSLTEGQYSDAKPFESRINVVNRLFEQGDRIVIFTARGMSSGKGDVVAAKEKWELITKKQLDLWGVKYHQLILGKPSGDFYVDDKAISDLDFFR